MSQTHDIFCMQCNEYLWIGQGDTVYIGDPQTMKALREFLNKHKYHCLQYGGTPIDRNWTRFEIEKEPTTEDQLTEETGMGPDERAWLG